MNQSHYSRQVDRALHIEQSHNENRAKNAERKKEQVSRRLGLVQRVVLTAVERRLGSITDSKVTLALKFLKRGNRTTAQQLLGLEVLTIMETELEAEEERMKLTQRKEEVNETVVKAIYDDGRFGIVEGASVSGVLHAGIGYTITAPPIFLPTQTREVIGDEVL